jgi:integrase
LPAAGGELFVRYTLRHTCITRWAKHVDPYTLHVIADHTDMKTTRRYVHPSDADIREAMARIEGQYGAKVPPEAAGLGQPIN